MTMIPEAGSDRYNDMSNRRTFTALSVSYRRHAGCASPSAGQYQGVLHQ